MCLDRYYPLYHEMDLSNFTEQMDRLIKKNDPHTRLRQRRDTAGMSQAELAKAADAPLRQIQLLNRVNGILRKL